MFWKFGVFIFIVKDPDPHWPNLEDPDPHTINSDPHPCWSVRIIGPNLPSLVSLLPLLWFKWINWIMKEIILYRVLYYWIRDYMRSNLFNLLPIIRSVSKRVVRLCCNCATLGLGCSCKIWQYSSGNSHLTKKRVHQHVMIPYLKALFISSYG